MTTRFNPDIWVGDDGELLHHPNNGVHPSNEDVQFGLMVWEFMSRPSSVNRISVTLEGWEDEIRVTGHWTVDPMAPVGGYIDRCAYGDELGPWRVHRVHVGYSPNRLLERRKEGTLGLAMKVKEYSTTFSYEVALLGLFGISRGPIASIQAIIPPKHLVPTTQPALRLNDQMFQESPDSDKAVDRLNG